MELSDSRWALLSGGYKTPYDPRPALERLERGDQTAWEELWDELHHQGDIGEAAYAAIPHIVRIYLKSDKPDWRPYAMVALIEETRRIATNPPLPDWATDDYLHSVSDLVLRGLNEFMSADTPELSDSIIAVISFSKDRVSIGKIAGGFTEDERQEMLEMYFQ